MQRRKFLKISSVALSGKILIPSIVSSTIFGANAPSKRINVGLIGTGRQGIGINLPGFLALNNVRIKSVCDVDSWRLEQARQKVDKFYGEQNKTGKFKGCSAHRDFREIINDKDIDAVMISTPDHWHVPMAMMAAKAGKHICLEKPLTLSVGQGRLLCEAVEKTRVVHRTDSEFRSIRKYNHAAELVRNGYIGTLQHIEIGLPVDPPPVPVQSDNPVPTELDYNMWLGPAQKVPYTEKRVHTPYDLKSRPHWMRISTYAQGMIANWGAHLFDIAQWANNSELTGPVEVEGEGFFPKSLWDTMINFNINYRYANEVTMNCKMMDTYNPFIKFSGTNGWIVVDNTPAGIKAGSPSLLDIKPKPGELDFSNTLTDKGDFIDSIINKRQTLQPFEVGHRTISISQIGLIACQIGGKLKWDPSKEIFEGNNAANSLLAAPLYRKWD